ncbi:helix-turn-helix domain-containing protein [Bacillus sp. MUM 116]|uniref:helix-turn-helix domain-containing protein n=1 Tax=Bacillus sp. MUM 116 TaxID=1678002 RepID=UPI0008F55847|nr:helix-turn-helix domain-containing protein [Bacillus sp. MUM 116]OIK11080.1 helix-turn-helix domain-containing protein [Bacillus sp. MUM 116]
MTELGNRLKEARLAKNLSLDDVQSMTKIQKRYLIGIEEGNYSSMPGNFYVRAFIKQYAEALQLNPDEIFETYKNDIPITHNEEITDQLSRVKSRKAISEGNSKFFDVLPKILIGVFVIGVAGLVYYLLYSHASSNSNDSINKVNNQAKIEKSQNLEQAKATEAKNSKTTKANNNSNDSMSSGAPSGDTKPKQDLKMVQTSGSNSTYTLSNTDKFEVKLVSNGQTWVNIKNGKGYSFFQGMLTTNGTKSKTVDLSKENQAVLIVGKTLDTDIYVNDQKLEYAVAPSKMVTQRITIQYVPKNK